MLIASAPGKLVALGEYAVLESAPALVFAINRRACVTLEADNTVRYAVSMGRNKINYSAFSISPTNEITWQDARDENRYTLLNHIWQALRDQHLLNLSACPGMQLNLDTDAFSDDVSGQPAKYGLGSSAALSTALAIALAGRQPETVEIDTWLSFIHTAHSAFQGGKGSGLDVAASLLGGAIEFRNSSGTPKAKSLRGPVGLSLGAVWTGISVPTSQMLAQLEEWKATDETRYFDQMAVLTKTAEAALTAFSSQQTEKFLQNFETYGNQLRILGEYSGLDIFSQEHEAISRCAKSCNVTYKTCGAGGGDIGIALCDNHECMQEFAKEVTAAGFRFLDLEIEKQGVALQ